MNAEDNVESERLAAIIVELFKAMKVKKDVGTKAMCMILNIGMKVEMIRFPGGDSHAIIKKVIDDVMEGVGKVYVGKGTFAEFLQRRSHGNN